MEINGKRVVVTGGAGFIGSHVTDFLVEKSNEVIIVDNFSTGKEANISHHSSNPNVHVVRVDVCDLETMVKVTEGVDIIFHLAAANLRVSLNDPQYVHEVNATGSLNMCRAALKNKVQLLIYISSSESYGSAINEPMAEDHSLNPTTVYGASKLAGEAYTRAFWYAYELPVIVVRPFNCYGPREHYEGSSAEVIPRFVFRVMFGLPPVIFGSGEQARDFTWVLDVARGIVMAGECDALIGDCVNIAKGKYVTINKLADLVLTILDRQDLKPIYLLPKGRPGDVHRHFADNTKARKLMNFEATVDIKEGLKRYIAWVKDQGIDVAHWANEMGDINW